MSINCNDLQVEPSDCRQFSESPFRTLLFVMEHQVTAESSDITYVTHLSFDRVSLMDNIARLWPGPISFTMYLSDAEFPKVVHLLSDSQLLSTRSNIAFHVVFKQGVSVTFQLMIHAKHFLGVL